MPRVQECTQRELPEVIGLVDDAMRQGMDQTMLTDYPLVYQDSNHPNIRVIKVDGRVVSVVPFLLRTVDVEDVSFTIGIISPTATDPEHRHRGYGLACLRSCLRSMEEMGCDLSVLWTQIATFPFYQHGAFEPVRYQEWIYTCTREDGPRFRDHGERIVRYDPATGTHLDRIRSMHKKEGYGVRRSRSEWEALLQLPLMHTLVAEADGFATGYLIVSDAGNKPGLIEAGGSVEAVETLYSHALRNLPEGGQIQSYDPLTGSTAGRLLEQKLPGRRQLTTKSMMIRINCPAAFLRKIRPWLERRTGSGGEEFSIGVTDAAEQISFRSTEEGLILGQEPLERHYELSRRELTSLVFGPHPVRGKETAGIETPLFPFYFPLWQLDQS